jgi:CRP-like cAMP-binding protein
VERAAFLRQVEMFAGLDRITLAKLAAHLEPVTVADGVELCRQGEEGDALYVISRGTFGVYAVASGPIAQARLATRNSGEVVGEMALLTGEPRSATLRAEGDGEVLRLDRGRFVALIRQDPTVALAIAAALSQRLRAADAARLDTPPSPPVTAGATPPGLTAADDTSPKQVPAAPQHPPRHLGRQHIGLGLAAVVLGGGWLVPASAGLAPVGWHALVILLALVPAMSLEALGDGVIALMLPLLWVLGGVAAPRVALSGFATPTWVLIVAISVIGAVIAGSGLAFRLAVLAGIHARGGFPGQLSLVGLAGLLLSGAMPSSTNRAILAAPATSELAEVFGYAPGTRPAAGLAMATLVGFGQTVTPFLTSSTTTILAFTLLPERSRAGVTWMTWVVRAAPANVLLFGGLFGFLIWWYAPRRGACASWTPAPRLDTLTLQRLLLGPVTRPEWLSAAIVLCVLVGFGTQPLHGIDPAWIAVLALALLACTGLVTPDALRAINWNFVLLFGTLNSLAGVVTSTQLDQWLARLVAGRFANLAGVPVLFVVVVSGVCFGLSFIIRYQALIPLLTIALAPVVAGTGIDPWIVVFIALLACNGFFVPFQSNAYLAMYNGTGGRLFTHQQVRPAAMAYGVLTLVALLASIPFWHALGLL